MKSLVLALLLTGPEPTRFTDLKVRADKAREAQRTEDAVRLYREALRLNPASTEAWWYLGMCLYEREQAIDAIDAFTRVSSQQPKQGAGWGMLGLSQFRAKRYDAALSSLRRAISLGVPELNNLDKVIRYHVVTLLNRAGQFDLASSTLMTFVAAGAITPQVTRAAGISALRLAVLPDAVPADQIEPVRLAGEAVVLAWQKRIAEAKQQAAVLLRDYPHQPNAHYLMGYLLLLENDQTAVEEFTKELERDPKHVPANLQIAYEYMKRGDPDEALPYAREATRIAPADFLARNIHGRILLELGKPQEAIPELQSAVKLAPANPEAHFHLASAYARAGRKTEAAEERRIFASLNGESNPK